MFDTLLLLLTVLGMQFTAYEDCTVTFDNPTASTPIVRFVNVLNELPDDQRFALCEAN